MATAATYEEYVTYEYIVDSPRYRKQIVDIAKKLLGSKFKVTVSRFNHGYRPKLTVNKPLASPRYDDFKEELFKEDMEGEAITLIDLPNEES